MNSKEQFKNLDESISIDSKYKVSKGFSIDDISYDENTEDNASNNFGKMKTKKEYISFGIDKDELQKRLSPDEAQHSEYRGVFVAKDSKKIEDQRQGVSWYLNIAKWPIVFIILINLLVIIRENSSYFKNFLFIDYIRLPIEISIFIILSYIIVQKRKQIPKISGITCGVAGFISGAIISSIELFVYRDMWTIFNLASTTIFLALMGIITGLIFGAVFYQDDMILSINKKYGKESESKF